MIVVVAPEDDPHALAVARALSRANRHDVFWLDLEKAFDKLSVVWQADASGIQWKITTRQDSSTLEPDQITAVYWRRPVSALTSPFLTLPRAENLDAYEIFWSLRWLLDALPDSLFPLGHPYSQGCAESKHRQMQTALRCGFRIPASFHSNDPAALRDFISAQGEVAIKALKLPGVLQAGSQTEARHIFCKAFPAEFLIGKLDAAQRTQLFCQESIRRTRDLRIMVFPREIIAAEIDVSSLPDNKLDWREDCLNMPHRIVTLPEKFQAQLREYLRLMGMKAGYFDFAVPDDGEPVFFECNTNAQWIWIEELTGHPIAEVIARELAEPLGS